MKYLVILIALATIFYSCGPTPTEQVIMDYEQTIDGTKTDLSMSIISSEKIGTLTFKDSATIYKDIFQQEVDESILKSENRYIEYKRKVIDAMVTMATARLPETIEHHRKSIDMYNSFAKNDSIWAQKYKNGDYSNSDLEKKYNLLKRYETSPDSIIADKYLTSYSIKNPLLNGVKQELKKEHWITPDNKVIYSDKKTE